MAGPMSNSAPQSFASKRKRPITTTDEDGSKIPHLQGSASPSDLISAGSQLEKREVSKNQGETKEQTLRDANSSSQTDGNGARAKPTRTRTRRQPKKHTKRTPSVSWPEGFRTLAQTHRALNLVYTFCCTRKHFATTFDNIKSAVRAQLGGSRELTVDDIARLKVLVPKAVRLEYVDEEKLEVMLVGERESLEYKLEGFDGGSTELDVEMGTGEGTIPGAMKEILLFEFLDGDLKRETQHPKSTTNDDSAKPIRKRSKEDDLKMPVYSQKQMLALIEKRNAKFSVAIDAFLVQCEDEGLNPVEQLEQKKDMYIPTPSLSSGANTPAAMPVFSTLPREIPKERKSVAEIIADIRELDWYHAQIVPDGHRVFDAQPSAYGDLAFPLSQDLVNALYNTKGITQFYSHQTEAMNHLYEGHNVIVSTSTSSGKSLIYQVPMLHELEKDPNSRGMYIFPTKALAQDQRRSMKDLLQYVDGLQDTLVETFDGDTPMEYRNMIREEARIIFTNPDMLHITILPRESAWRTYLQNLKFVVVDELHVYNGLFGSHVAYIMRRLRRLCAAVGNRHVKFISCSATVANPEEHMEAVFGVNDVKLVDFDGSPSGRKEFLCWNTPTKDPEDPTSGRGDPVAETARLFCQLIARGVRVIAFCRVRKMCEILLQAVRSEFHNLERPEIGKLVMGYRGGYSPQDRRRIEKDMFEGRLMGIVATNALELGVDIGSLDAVITLGFPYSISNLRQQSGRAGRRNKDSLSVLVADNYPTDQHYMMNPDELFTRPNCELQIDLANELILEGHLQCAAFEMPIHPEEDSMYFDKQLPDLAATRLIKDESGFYHCNARFRPQPSRCVSIRDTEEEHFAVIDTTHARNVVLEEVEASRALFTIYEGGIFLHQGQTFLIQELNTDRRFARVVRVHVDWHTMQRDYTDIDPIETEAMRVINESCASSRAFHGSVQIHSVVYGFFKVDKRGQVLDAVEVDNPPIDIFTKGMWLNVPKRALETLESRHLNIAAAIHAAEHAVLSLLPTFVISSPGDVRTECKVAKKELGGSLKLANEPTTTTKNTPNTNPTRQFTRTRDLQPPSRKRPARLTFYDAKGGSCGSGIASKALEFIDVLLRRAISRIEACECSTPQGCIECVCDEQCKEMNIVMSKAGAGVVLRCLMGWEVDVNALPWGEECFEGDGVSGDRGGGGELAGGLETVVEAVDVPWKKYLNAEYG